MEKRIMSERENAEKDKTRLFLDQFHDSSIPPRKCAKSLESVPKPEKV